MQINIDKTLRKVTLTPSNSMEFNNLKSLDRIQRARVPVIIDFLKSITKNNIKIIEYGDFPKIEFRKGYDKYYYSFEDYLTRSPLSDIVEKGSVEFTLI